MLQGLEKVTKSYKIFSKKVPELFRSSECFRTHYLFKRFRNCLFLQNVLKLFISFKRYQNYLVLQKVFLNRSLYFFKDFQKRFPKVSRKGSGNFYLFLEPIQVQINAVQYRKFHTYSSCPEKNKKLRQKPATLEELKRSLEQKSALSCTVPKVIQLEPLTRDSWLM